MQQYGRQTRKERGEEKQVNLMAKARDDEKVTQRWRRNIF